MKKLILTLALVAMTLAASANSVRYFTRSQATRVANTLDAQAELMIYCGYEYELATYVIINEVWAEPVNSKYYEIWLFGYDAYTGEEIYMPIDLSCIWLFNKFGNRMYSAAQYLRFRSTVSTPNFYWTMPPYNPFVRYYHDPHFNHMYTYHYEIHRHGWRPPTYPKGGPLPYHPYYMRTPHTPAPVPQKPFTPGVDHPSGNGNYNYLGNTRGNNTRSTSFNSVGGVRTGSNNKNNGNPGVTSRTTSSNSNDNGTRQATNSSNTRGASNTREISNSSNTRGTTNTSSNTRETNNTSNIRGTTTNNTNTRGTTTSTSTNTRGTTSNTSNTRGTTTNNTNTRSTTTNTSTTTRGTTTNNTSNTRGTSTDQRTITDNNTKSTSRQQNSTNSRTGQNGVRNSETKR